MKKIKKLVAVMLAAIMVMAMGTSVFAESTSALEQDAGGTTYSKTTTYTDGDANYDTYGIESIKYTYDDNLETTLLQTVTTYIDGTVTTDTYSGGAVTSSSTSYLIQISNDIDDYEYTAYQIFTGTLSSDGKTLSDIKFGTALNATDQASVLEYYSDASKGGNILDGTTYEKSAAGLAAALAAKAITAEDFATYIGTFTLTSAGTSSFNADHYEITVTGAGYYLIANTVVPSTAGAAGYTSYILKVVKSTTATPKNTSVPTGDKSVTDVNDSTSGSTVTGGDSADYDIGDNVPFTLTATMPDSISKYTTYALTFHDDLSTGLSFNSSSVVVKVGNTTIPETYTPQGGATVTNYTVVTSTGDDCDFHVVFTDVLSLVDDSGNEVTVESGTVITVSYTAELTSSATYKETNEMYIVYSNNPNGEGTGTSTTKTTAVYNYTLTVTKTTSNGSTALAGAEFTLYKYNGSTYEAVGDAKTGNGTGSNVFTWSGLDDGTYKLVETKTPDGYNTMDDLYFKVVVGHTETEITSITITDLDGNTISDVSNGTFTTTASDGKVSTTIKNYSGAEIPETGGMGTTILYIIGAILVIGAAVILVTRRRMANK